MLNQAVDQCMAIPMRGFTQAAMVPPYHKTPGTGLDKSRLVHETTVRLGNAIELP